MTLPEGTVTFLRTDIEGSMALVRALGARYDALNSEHQAMVRAVIAKHGGQVVRTEGDAFFAVFTDARAAAGAAVDIQAAMREHPWPEGHELKLRIGLHSGSAVRAGDDYGGFEVNRAARVAATGWGGQIVVSDAARALIVNDLQDGWAIRDLGTYRLSGIAEPEHLFQLDAPGADADFAPLRSRPGPAEQLPVRVASFIGREVEIAELDQLLRANRLLTLTGPGGTGKTTLALELGRRHAAHLKDGTWFVDLQAIRDPALVRSEIAHGIGLFDGAMGTAAERLMDFVADRSMLIVIDNYEQVIEAAADVGALLQASPRTRIIVTSRTPLRISAEQEYPVRPMGIAMTETGDEGEAVRLFVDRVGRVRPGTTFDEADMESVRRICRLLDGLPLAIELTAARAALMPLNVIAERLAKRLPLPGAGPRDLPDRQRTMEDAVAWSYDLLEPPLQRLLARASVFEESFELEQAETVLGPSDELGIDVLDGIIQLVERSLLSRSEDPAGGFRFAMLKTIRSFASARLAGLGEDDEMASKHAAAYAELASRSRPHWQTDAQPAWLARLGPDDANLRAALVFAIDHDQQDDAFRLLAGLWRYWYSTGHLGIAYQLMRRAMAMPDAGEPTVLRASALDAAGGIAYWTGQMEEADTYYEEQRSVGELLDDEQTLALAYLNLTFTRQLRGDLEGSRVAEEAARRHATKTGDEDLILRIDWVRGLQARIEAAGSGERTDDADGLDEIEAVAERLESRNDSTSRTRALGTRAQIAVLRGDSAGAVKHGLEAFRLALALGERGDLVIAMQPLVVLLIRADQPTAAATLLGALDATVERYGIRPPASFELITGVADPAALLAEALGAEGLAGAVERGRHLSFEDMLDVVEAATQELASPLPGSSVTPTSSAQA